MNFKDVIFYVTLCHWSVTNVEVMVTKWRATKNEPLYWSTESLCRVMDGYMGKITVSQYAKK